MTGYTVFITYLFENDIPFEIGKSFGYTTPIHCNYIQKLEAETLTGKQINFSFNDLNQFAFMKSSSGITSSDGYGWNANKIYALVQIINERGDDIKPSPSDWRKIEVTNQIRDYSTWSGTTIPPEFLVDSVLSVTLGQYQEASIYNLNTYLNLPTDLENEKLSFGEEVFFFGNVQTDINAIIYTSNIDITLPLNQFNTSNNPTWMESESVYISEIGIFDENENLVAIGKLNYPIEKNDTKQRTFAVNIDF
ncbi:MAG: hypothetical protein ACOC33_00335 [bacterium]